MESVLGLMQHKKGRYTGLLQHFSFSYPFGGGGLIFASGTMFFTGFVDFK